MVRKIDDVVQKRYVQKEARFEGETQSTAAGQSTNGEIKPVEKGFFGNIYDQFKGKAKEAFKFLGK